jgi:two-component system CheB/CheR fusion protein
MFERQSGAICMAGAGYGEAETRFESLHGRALAVVAICGSGGAVAVVETLVRELPRDCGLALVALLDGTAVDQLADRLLRQGAIPALLAEHDMPLRPDRLYLLRAPMLVRDGRLMAAPQPVADAGAFDVLLESLAASEGSRSVAVVLSGDGQDGSLGIAAIHRRGGRILVQAPADAAAPERPAQAVATGLADQILPASELAPALARLAAEAKATELADPVLRAIRQPVAVLDATGGLLRANAAFHRSFGTPQAPGQGGPLAQALQAVPRLAAFLGAEAMRHDDIEDSIVEVTLPEPAGRRLLRLSASRLSPSPPETLLAIEDITESTRLAARLELAKAIAERADRDKSRFLAAASHDLRQPLQSMSMLHGLLAAKAGDPAMLRLISRLDESIDTMSGILDVLLDLNQMEAGGTQAAIAPVPLGPLMAELEREFAAIARGAGLDWRLVPSHALVVTDARLLRQILRNLLANALKYTRQGRILLGCRRVGGILRVEVWDTGIGIPRAQMPKVFEESYEISSTARARSQGLGLGLAIARRLADLLGHPIGVRSRENAGSCFHIDLPFAEAGLAGVARAGVGPAGVTLAAGAGAAPQRRAPATATGSSRILVIEDDAAVAEGLRLLLLEAGHSVMLAHQGSEAIAMAVANPPALVVTDFNLPGPFNGIEVTLQLRQLLGVAPAAIILSGDTSARTRQEIGLLDVEYAPKPIRADDLLARVRRLLPAAAVPPPRQAEAEPPPPLVESGAAEAPIRAGPAEAQAALEPASVGRVFIVDDDPALRRDIAEWLEANGWTAEVFASAEAFLEADDPGRQGCVLVDAVMPGMDGIKLLDALRGHAQRLPAIMVTGHGDIRMAVRAMAAGAMDFIEKPIRRHDLLRSICNANARIANAMGEAAVRAEVAARLARLTPRQREILDRVIAGSPSKIIAAELKLNQRTVENHRAAIMAKLNARSLPELIRKVVSVGTPLPGEG